MFPTVTLLMSCGALDHGKIENKKINTSYKLAFASIVGDTLIAITALVLGILGVLSILHGMSLAASYALLGVSGFIIFSWLVLSGISKGDVLNEAARIVQVSISSDPK